MEAKIKNTLFRFVTFRKPEQIDEAKKLSLFVHHPNPTLSALYATTEAAFETNLSAFATSAKTKDQLIAINPALYNLGLWVLQNRDSVNTTSFQMKMTELGIAFTDTLSESDEIMVWDNFIYQIGKHVPSSSALDAAMTLLYANYLLNQQTIQNSLNAQSSTSSFTSSGGPVSTDPMQPTVDEKNFKRALQARIVRPAFMAFSASSTSPVTPASLQVTIGARRSLSASIQNIENRLDIESLNSLKGELESSQKKYQKLEAAHLKSYNEEYNQGYNVYLEDLKTDPSAQAPLYNYAPLSELDAIRLENELSADSFNLLNSFSEKLALETYSEVLQFIDTEIKNKQTSTNLNARTSIGYNLLGPAAITIPTVSPLDVNTFSIKAKKLFAGKYNFLLSVQLPNDSIEITNIKSKVLQSTDVLAESSDDMMENLGGLATGTLFQLNPVVIPSGATFVDVEIHFTTSIGNKYVIYDNVKLNSTLTFGNLQEDSADSGATNGNSNSGSGTNSGTTTDSEEIPNYQKYGVTRLGIADYRKVEQSICCYVPGEVSHIENIMAREYKERATKRLRRSETTVTTERSTETENLTDTTTTEKNEMHQEVSKMQQQSMDFNINAGIHFGKSDGFGGNLNTSFAYHNSKEESNNMSRSEAKDVTERAMERVVSKVREERIQKIIDEFTEENKHGFDNREGDKHISGVYRWIDKVYKNEIFNYGKRLMYEFMIPQPAKFHTLFTSGVDRKFNLEKPIDPRTVTTSNNGIPTFNDLTDINYKIWASAFNAEVEAPPIASLVLGKAYSATSKEAGGWEKQWNDLKVPEGYALSNVDCRFDHRRIGTGNISSYVQIGKYGKMEETPQVHGWNGFNSGHGYEADYKSFQISGNDIVPIGSETVPVSVLCYDVVSFSLNVNCTFSRSTEWFTKWQIETFNKIIQAYEDKLAQYEQKLAEFKSEASAQIKVNPLFNRSIENTVLRKHCISYILGYAALGKDFQSGTDSIKNHSIKTAITGTDAISLKNYASLSKFIEQAFEWEIMSYIFYPFYWAGKDDWSALYAADAGDDTLFAKFLQSGMARVIVTVRPGFEDAVNWFLETGQIWNGNSSAPVIGDELYLSIVDELQEPEYYIEGAWETRVPSTLTVIQSGVIGLDASGLPCECKRKYDEEGNVIEGSKDEIILYDDLHLQAQTQDGVGYWQVNPDEGTPIIVPPKQTESV